MARGYVFRPKYRDRDGSQRQSNVWWIGYSVDGEKRRESAETQNKEEAQRFLTRRLREADLLGPRRQDLAKVPFSELADRIRKDYKRNGYRSVDVERRLTHLEDFFGGLRVARLGNEQVDAYVDHRLEEGAANATVNRELSALRRMFTLGEKANMVAPDRVPDVASYMLEENNERTGFWTEEEFQKLRAALPPRLRPLVDFGYVTGWRRSELLSRDWRHVDLDHGSIRLEPGETKSGEGREFPLNDHLRAVVERQLERKEETERKHGCKVKALFFYYEPSKNGLPAGRRIKSFRRAWATATEAAGVPDRIFHDFRRTSARNLVRAGVSENVVMELCGWESRSVFDRYNIVTRADLRDAVSKLPAPAGRSRQGKDNGSSEEAET